MELTGHVQISKSLLFLHHPLRGGRGPGAIGIMPGNTRGWRCRSPGSGRREGVQVYYPPLTPLALRRRQSLIPLNTKSSFLLRELLASAGAPRTGSSAPLLADNRSRVGCIVKTGYPSGDIPRFPGPSLGSRDRERFVAEASTRCLVACGSQPSLEPPALRSSSTRSVPPFRPREQF